MVGTGGWGGENEDENGYIVGNITITKYIEVRSPETNNKRFVLIKRPDDRIEAKDVYGTSNRNVVILGERETDSSKL